MEEIAATPHVEMEEIARQLQHPRRQPKTEWPTAIDPYPEYHLQYSTGIETSPNISWTNL